FKGTRKGLKKEQKKRANPVSLGGVSSVCFFSDWLNQMGLNKVISVQTQMTPTFLIVAGLLFTNLHQ
ncbi:MAG: hypothetical protein J6X11_01310, partial [Treponema sp.]|nr:hypothetical protein [Treponema sp.]